MWYVYILLSQKDGKLYIGITDNLKLRFAKHNNGEVFSTKGRTPFILESYIAVKSQEKAAELEKYFKSGSGSAVLKKRII